MILSFNEIIIKAKPYNLDDLDSLNKYFIRAFRRYRPNFRHFRCKLNFQGNINFKVILQKF